MEKLKPNILTIFPKCLYWLLSVLLVNLIGFGEARTAAQVDTISTVSITNVSAENFPEISVTMSVLDHYKNTIPGLGNTNFSLQEDSVPEEAVAASKLTRVGVIDIVVVFDTTVSMRNQISSLKNKVTDLADSLKAHAIDYAFGLVTYGDDYRIANNGNLTADVTVFQTWIGNLKAEGGGSVEENVFDAVKAAARMNFRSNAQKIFLVITDAPAWTAGAPGSPTTSTLAGTVDTLKAAQVTCHVVGPRRTEYYGSNGLAEGTGGVFYEIGRVNFDLIVDRIISIITGQYVLTYYTHNTWADGTQRTVRGDVNVAGDAGWAANFYRAPDYSTILFLAADTPTPKVGSNFTIEVHVGRETSSAGDDNLPAKNFYGVSYCVEYDPLKVIYQGSVGKNFLISDTLYREWADAANGVVCFSVSKKFPPGENGSGILRALSFTSPESVPDQTPVQFKLTRTAAYAPNWVHIPLQTEDLTITLRDTLFYQVWPGDTDNNGRVDEADVLPVGFYFNERGYARENASPVWQAQKCIAWKTRPAATYADANGNGQVNWDDISVIEQNWGKTHDLRNQFVSLPAASSVPGTIEFRNIETESAEAATLHLQLSAPIEVAGVAFKIRKPAGVIKAEAIKIPESNAQNCLQLIYQEPGSEFISVACVVNREISGLSELNLKIKTNENFSGETVGPQFKIEDLVLMSPRGQIYRTGPTNSVPATELEPDVPKNYRLFQNYPNPFNAITKIRFQLPNAAFVRVEILDVTGSQIAWLANQNFIAGEHELVWNGQDVTGKPVSSGIYFYRLETRDWVQSRKLILLK